MEPPERLSLDCESLDTLLGGGVEHGVVTNVYGGAGSGKTNVCIQATASCLQRGGTVVFVDTEGGFSAERYLQIHDDKTALDRLHLSEPTTFDEQQQVFTELPDTVEEVDADLIVVDSLVSLYRLQLNGDDVQDVNTELSTQFSILSKLARERDLPVVVTNQVYSEFDSDENELVGRDIPAYWSKTLIELESLSQNKRQATLRKHRSRPEGLGATFFIVQDGLTAEDETGNGDRMQIF